MAQLHRLDNSIYDPCGAKTCSQTQKEHFAILVAAQCLHGRVVDDLHRALEGAFKVEALPTLSQIPRFGSGVISKHWARVTDRNGVKFPVGHEFPDLRHHPFGSQSWPRNKLPLGVLTGGQDLNVSSADIDDQHGLHFTCLLRFRTSGNSWPCLS